MYPSKTASLVLAAVLAWLLVPSTAAAVAACPAATTLEELVTCLKDSSHMPRSGSNDFVSPTLTERLDWAAVVSDMLDATLAGTCAGIALPGSLTGLYEVTTFTDASNLVSYCVLAEIALVGDLDKKAWGTFITSTGAVRELAVQIPHPLNDLNTPEQGIRVFKTVGARSYLLSGAHRNANGTSSCQSSFNESDAAHETVHMFQPTTEETLAWYQVQQLNDELVVVQLHGMGSSTCPGVDAYMTYGRPPGDGTPSPGDDILTLQSEIETRHPGWVVVVPGGTPTCTLNATTNTQGRFLNDVDASSVCGTAATGYSGRFIHIEQKSAFRLAEDWVDAIEAAWPVGCTADEHFEGGMNGWINGAASTCTSGDFVAATPSEQSSSGGIITQVGGDHTTGPPPAGAGLAVFTATNTSNGTDDVDGGVCILESPVYAVSEDSDLSIWYFHGQSETGNDPGDFFLLEISTDGGANYSTLVSIGDVETDAVWSEAATTVTAGADVKLRVQVADGTADGNLIEGGVDDLMICPAAPPCVTDPDCDDGLFCNGAESCVGGACQAGSDPCPGQSCDEGGDICVDADPVLWMSFRSNTAVPGVGTVADEDIVSYDEATGTWALEFDGSDVGLGGLEISGLAVLPAGDLLLSFTAAGTVGGLSVDDSDIVQFTPTSLGTATAGTFSLYFDGSDVGLTSNSEDVDAIALAADGRLIVSTTGGFSGTGASGSDEDLFLFTGTLGSSTSGSFAQHFDGSDVGLGGNSALDIDAVEPTATGELLFSTVGDFAITGASGSDEDVVEFSGTFGSSTSGTFTLRLDLSTLGIATGEDIGSLALVAAGGPGS